MSKFFQWLQNPEIKNPVNRFFISCLVLFEVALAIYWSSKHNFSVTWDEFFPGPLFLTSFMAFSFGTKAILTYRAMKKTD
jgi:hypothetical protein